jgi:hypothetical protein
MPFSQCPECGALFHLVIHDPTALAEWNRKHAVERERNEPPKYLCYECWLKAGQPQDWLPPLQGENQK